MAKETWRLPEWIYRDKRPPNDDAYFENMTRVIFLAGLSWKMIDKKWVNFKKAFEDFSVDKVSEFKPSDVERLMKDAGIVRNRAKITAAIENAKQIRSVREKSGSFRSFLDGLDKSNNYAAVIKELGKRFRRLGPSSARIFLYTVGENIKRPMEP
jgi:DNA-3-methyladenine glycosylase I